MPSQETRDQEREHLLRNKFNFSVSLFMNSLLLKVATVLVVVLKLPHATQSFSLPTPSPVPVPVPTHVTPFQRFAFASNNVCTTPQSFHATRNLNGTDIENLEFTMRNVPGDGDCMFLAVALATSTSMGLGGNDALLRAVANETRTVVSQVLSTPVGDRVHLHLEGKRIVRVSDLLTSAARGEGVTTEVYLELVGNGTLQGGGPELAVLSNVLRRPISIYELDYASGQFANNTIPEVCRIKCAGSFGDMFKDPLSELPRSAIISGLQQGAYSWHIHILVVESGGGEKHACALLPKHCYL